MGGGGARTDVGQGKGALEHLQLEALLGEVVHVVGEEAAEHLHQHLVEQCARYF